jgi:hypothetical protein
MKTSYSLIQSLYRRFVIKHLLGSLYLELECPLHVVVKMGSTPEVLHLLLISYMEGTSLSSRQFQMNTFGIGKG